MDSTQNISNRNHNSNPFQDPPAGSEDASLDRSNVLNVDRNATLTLGTEALIILDEGLRHRRAPRNLCGLLPQLSKTTRSVPYHQILWCELSGLDVTIHYAQSNGKRKACRVGFINYGVVTDKERAKAWVERLLQKAYPANVMRKKRMKVLVNPFGGQGNAQKLWTREVEPLFAAARCEVDVQRTAYKGHAIEIAEKLDIENYDVVACASGDGLPHEVFNGFARRKDARRALRKIAVVQIPCGSGNATSLNLNGTGLASLAALEIVKGIRTPLDLMAITQGSEKFYSFLSQSVGIIAEADLGTEALRWMGSFRFTWGVLVRLLGKTVYPAEIAVVVDTDDKRLIREAHRRAREEHACGKSQPSADDIPAGDEAEMPPLQYGTVASPLHPSFVSQDLPNLGNFYVGNMAYMTADCPFFPASLPSDGKMDMLIIAGDIPRTTASRMITTIDSGSLLNIPESSYRKVLAYRIYPRTEPTPPERRLRAKIGKWLGGAAGQKEGLISIDGEKVPFEPFQVEICPRLGMVLSKSGGVYELEEKAVPR